MTVEQLHAVCTHYSLEYEVGARKEPLLNEIIVSLNKIGAFSGRAETVAQQLKLKELELERISRQGAVDKERMETEMKLLELQLELAKQKQPSSPTGFNTSILPSFDELKPEVFFYPV